MSPKNIDNYVQYDCDVKNFRLSTDIQISSNNKKFGSVTGNIFRIVEDPLTMSDASGNKMAYAGDLFGQTYDIYNTSGEKIARAEFNYLNTAGEIYDTNGTLIATYGSFVFFNDFTVKISNDSEIDPTTLLMIFCSYYSDQSYDNS